MLRTQTLEAAILGSSFHQEDAGTGKCHFGILPLAYQRWDLAPPIRLSAPVMRCIKPSNQPGRHTARLTSRPVALRPPEPTAHPETQHTPEGPGPGTAHQCTCTRPGNPSQNFFILYNCKFIPIEQLPISFSSHPLEITILISTSISLTI